MHVYSAPFVAKNPQTATQVTLAQREGHLILPVLGLCRSRINGEVFLLVHGRSRKPHAAYLCESAARSEATVDFDVVSAQIADAELLYAFPVSAP